MADYPWRKEAGPGRPPAETWAGLWAGTGPAAWTAVALCVGTGPAAWTAAGLWAEIAPVAWTVVAPCVGTGPAAWTAGGLLAEIEPVAWTAVVERSAIDSWAATGLAAWTVAGRACPFAAVAGGAGRAAGEWDPQSGCGLALLAGAGPAGWGHGVRACAWGGWRGSGRERGQAGAAEEADFAGGRSPAASERYRTAAAVVEQAKCIAGGVGWGWLVQTDAGGPAALEGSAAAAPSLAVPEAASRTQCAGSAWHPAASAAATPGRRAAPSSAVAGEPTSAPSACGPVGIAPPPAA